MIVIIGLVILLAAVLIAVVAVATNTGGTHSVGDHFAILGHPLTGMSTGRLFLDGIVLGVVAMLGLSMLLGTFNRRLASRKSRRELTGSRRQSAALRLDRERLTQQLDDERSERDRVDATISAPTAPAGTGQTRPAGTGSALDNSSAGRTAVRPGLWQRISHPADR